VADDIETFGWRVARDSKELGHWPYALQQRGDVLGVARSRQVCIYVVEALLVL
jgi:hypothetical protein